MNQRTATGPQTSAARTATTTDDSGVDGGWTRRPFLACLVGGVLGLVLLAAVAVNHAGGGTGSTVPLPRLGSDNGFLRVCNSAHFISGSCGMSDAHVDINDGHIDWIPRPYATWFTQQVLTPAGWHSYDPSMLYDDATAWAPCVPDSGCEQLVDYEPGQVWRVIAHDAGPDGPVLGSVTFEYSAG